MEKGTSMSKKQMNNKNNVISESNLDSPHILKKINTVDRPSSLRLTCHEREFLPQVGRDVRRAEGVVKTSKTEIQNSQFHLKFPSWNIKIASCFWINYCLVLCLLLGLLSCGKSKDRLHIASKNFTEQIILGEIMAQLIEAKSNITVERSWNLGGTMICHQALINGKIDLYPEYTGTALISILNEEETLSSNDTIEFVRNAYQQQFDCTWLEPFGFSNTYALTVRQEDAHEHGWQSISDLSEYDLPLHAGFTAEFAERKDGYPKLKQFYGFEFTEISDLDPGLLYTALQTGEVDVISAFSTDGRIPKYNLSVLDDDKNFFPPYDAVPVIHNETIVRFPQLIEILNQLALTIDQETMQQLNYSVDSGELQPKEAAHKFLSSQGLLK